MKTYAYLEAAPLECPIAAFGGTEDLEANQEELDAWACHTSSDFTLEMIEGDHFFLQTGKDFLLPSVSRILHQYL